ncbi:hypothetical protein O3M35_004535 [Rhynocoris fuscipes]|uniref:P97 cofactor p47 n=1 Tax=Rhynocoris fuscipes TaxID=488301 RepID=A0AAW1CG44_9HEMI
MSENKAQSDSSKADEDSNKQSVLLEFVQITGTELANGRFYLESANWNLEMALANYYEDLAFGGDGGIPKKKEERSEGVAIETIDLDSDGDDDKPLDDTVPTLSNAPAAHSTQPKERPRFATMSSIRVDESSSDEEQGQTYYAGGSENSGQQVVGPARQSNQLITELFRSLREHGGIEGSSQDTSGGSTFTGQGYRLGQSADDTQIVAPASASHSSTRRAREVVLRLWRDGFSLDDGPLRLYTDPNEREFLSRIRQGSVPAELLPNIEGDSVSMSLEDHRHEYYRAPKETSTAKPFTGEGHVLGSTLTSSQPTEEKAETAESSTSLPPFQLNTDQPTTVVQVRLPDGIRIKVKLNTSHTIGHLRSAIISERPEFAGRNFRLITTFPSRELNNDNLTIKEADLLNSCLLLQN